MKNEKKISAQNFLPKIKTLNHLRKAAATCRGCHLYKHATQTVFGEGQKQAKLIVVGEIPGDKEDIQGRPFVGPAGLFLHKTMEDVGIDLEDTYFTNVVKHFKFVYSYKRRLHRSPVTSEIKACTPWLEAEINVIKPKAILCLGSVAAKYVVNKDFLIKTQHGKWVKYKESISAIATFHPSAILRAIVDEDRREMKILFIKDIEKVAQFMVETTA